MKHGEDSKERHEPTARLISLAITHHAREFSSGYVAQVRTAETSDSILRFDAHFPNNDVFEYEYTTIIRNTMVALYITHCCWKHKLMDQPPALTPGAQSFQPTRRCDIYN